MIQPGTKFDVQGTILEAVESTREGGCTACVFNEVDMSTGIEGCHDPNHDHDCFDLVKGTYVIFKKATE